MRYLILTLILIALLGISSVQAQPNPSSGPYNLFWSPDGTKIAGVGFNFLQIWNSTTGILLADLSSVYNPNSPYSIMVFSASWSPDSTRFVTASDDGIMRIWDAVHYELIYQTDQFTNALIGAAEWHPSGQYIMVGGIGGGRGYLLDVNTKEVIGGYELGLVYELAWKPSVNEYVVAVSDVMDGVVVFALDITSGLTTVLWRANEDGVRTIQWSNNGNLLAVGYNNGTIVLWDAVNNVEYARLQGEPNDEIDDLSFNSDDSVLISAQGAFGKLWSVATRQLLAEYPYMQGVAQASPTDPNRLVIADWQDNQITFDSVTNIINGTQYTPTPITPTSTFTPTPTP
jgi:WD40 repeat protein